MSPFTKHLVHTLPVLVLPVAILSAGRTMAATNAPPAWHLETAPVRAVYLSDEIPVSTVELPVRVTGGEPFRSIAAFSGTTRLPVKEIARSSETITAVVDGSGTPPGAEIALYGLPAPVAGEPAFTNKTPVRFRITQSGVFESPPTAADMITMADGHPRHTVFEFDIGSVGYLKSAGPDDPRGWHRSNWRNYTYLAEYSGLLRVPEKGAYRFSAAKRASGPVYLILDGELVLDLPNKGMRPLPDRPKRRKGQRNGGNTPVPAKADERPTEWEPASAPVELEKGLVPFRVLTFCKRFCEVTLGWTVPAVAGGGGEMAPVPEDAWAAARPPRAVRIDDREAKRPFTTAIDLEPGSHDSYAFDGCDAIFLPVRLRSLHPRTAAAGAFSCSWKWKGSTAPSIEGDEISAIIVKNKKDENRPRVRLSVRNEALGHTARAETEVPFPAKAAIRHRLSAGLTGIVPFAYPIDYARPELEVRTTLPDKTPLLARATFLPRDKEKAPEVVEETILPVKNWCRMILPAKRVGEIAAIEWEILHAGAVVTKGRTTFEHAPFRQGPDDARGDELLAGDDSIVLVPHLVRDGASPSRPVLHEKGRVAILDGFATPDGGFDAKALEAMRKGWKDSEGLSIETIRPTDLPEDGAFHEGLGPAAHLASIERPDLLVIAPDFRATANGATLAPFERHLAALAAIARDVLGAQVILLTPPPGLLSAAGLEKAPDMRPYAEAVLRVADAHNLPVADLYTLCRTRAARAVAPDGTLTPEGARLAGEAIASRITR